MAKKKLGGEAVDAVNEMAPVAVTLPALAENGIDIDPAANESPAWKIIREPVVARLRGNEVDVVTSVGGMTLVMLAGPVVFTEDGVKVATKELPA